MQRRERFLLVLLLVIAVVVVVRAALPTLVKDFVNDQLDAPGVGVQRQATQEQMMKDCMKKEHAKDASMSKEQLKTTCKAQMQSQPKE